MRHVLVGSLVLAGCGRFGFEASTDGDAGIGNKDPAAFACNTSQFIASVSPTGLAVVGTSTGVTVAWSDGSASLAGRSLDFDGDAIVASSPLASSLPYPIHSFGMVSDGAGRLMLGAQVGSDALFAPLGTHLQMTGGLTMVPSVTVTSRAVAAPSATGRFAASWLDTTSDQIVVTQIDDNGAATGSATDRPSAHVPQIRYAAQRDVLVWSADPLTGCFIDAYDDLFTPLLFMARIYGAAKLCTSANLARHTAIGASTDGINLLTWLDGKQLHGQLGTDTDSVGAELVLGDGVDASDIAVAPSGFFTAVASGTTLAVGHVRIDTAAPSPILSLPHLAGSPFELIERGDDALLLSVANEALQLTRICEP